MVELDLLPQLGSLIKHDHLNEPELNYGCFSSHLFCLGVIEADQSRGIFLIMFLMQTIPSRPLPYLRGDGGGDEKAQS